MQAMLKGKLGERILAITGLLAFASVLLWMNRFQYTHAGPNQILVRVNRFTGQNCFLVGNGLWDSRITPPVKKDDKWAKYEAGKLPEDLASYAANKDEKQNLDSLIYDQTGNNCR
jgi:hypothetical protein